MRTSYFFFHFRICSSFRQSFSIVFSHSVRVVDIAFDVHSLWSNDIWYLLAPYCCTYEHRTYMLCIVYWCCVSWRARPKFSSVSNHSRGVYMFWYICLSSWWWWLSSKHKAEPTFVSNSFLINFFHCRSFFYFYCCVMAFEFFVYISFQ